MRIQKITVIPTLSDQAQKEHTDEKELWVCAYCRVSTNEEEQLSSYEAQVEYYTDKILQTPGWRFAGIYADEGISSTSTRLRVEFNRMIADCMVGKIDMVLTKSVSRFARNTVDSLKCIRQLKDMMEFIESVTAEITEYSDMIPRKLIDRITVITKGRLQVRFKDGTEIEQEVSTGK